MRKIILVSFIIACAALIAVHFGSGRSMLGNIIDALWPVYLAIGVITATACFLFDAPRQLGWSATLTALAGSIFLVASTEIWVLGAPHEAAMRQGAASEPLRIATFNTWARNTEFDAAVAYLADSNFDLISAQEVGRNTRALPRRLRAAYPHQFSCGRGVYVFSRRPFINSGCPSSASEGNQRVPAAWVDIEWKGEITRFVALHLARPMEMHWRRPQIARLESFIAASGNRSMIIAGDFNTSHSGRAARDIADRFMPLTRRDDRRPTWPVARLSPIPLLALDQIWLSPDLCLSDTDIGPALGSDHRPVTGEVERCHHDAA